MNKPREHEHHNPEAMPRRDQDLELLKRSHIMPRLRDTCAHLVLKLEWCRSETFYNPDRCTKERHLYEECQYIAWKDRIRRKEEMKAAEAAAAAAAAAEAK
ncbi:hypothetical protein ACA910_012720 [Epithemia clementina (nom. ined.)]